MKTIKIGGTDWETSAVALGIMRMGARNVTDAATALKTAVNSGINFIDSADIYGGGGSEDVFGRALKLSGIRRDTLFIQSKAGIVPGHDGTNGRYDFDQAHLLQAVDGILARMGIDYLDSFVLHRPDPLMDLGEVAATLDSLQTSGKVRHFGVSNFNVQQFEMLQAAVRQPLLVNQLQFSLMHTGMIDAGMHTNMTDAGSVDHDGGLIEFSRRKHVTIQAWSPFQYGMFAGTFIGSDKFPELNALLNQLAAKYDVDANAIAVAWILRHPANIQVVLGTMTPAHISGSAAGANVTLTKQEWYDLYFAAGNDMP